MFKEIIDYLKDNPEGYWFKRKIYGWGWVPATWQGWFAVLVFVLFLMFNAFMLSPEPTIDEVNWLIIKTIISIAIIIFICYKKGEKPKWQWGIPKKDDK